MGRLITRFIEHRRRIRQRWQDDARRLALLEEANAYYEAQRRAAKARARKNRAEFLHWAKVAAEIAGISPEADMDPVVLRGVVEKEMNR